MMLPGSVWARMSTGAKKATHSGRLIYLHAPVTIAIIEKSLLRSGKNEIYTSGSGFPLFFLSFCKS